MNMKFINAIHLKEMRNGVHFLFMKTVLDLAKEDTKVTEKCATLVSALETAFGEEDKNLALSRKNFKSDEIGEADKERDTLYIKYRNAVKAFVNFPVEEKAEAAKHLWQSIRDYNIDTRSSMQQEGGLLTNLLTDLEGPLANYVETLGLATLVADMKKANQRVYDITQQRTGELSTQEKGALRAAREKSDKAYQDLVEMVDAYAMTEGVGEYASFINRVNTEITQYRRNAMNQKADSTQPVPGTGGGDTGSGSGSGGNTGGGNTGGDTGGSDTSYE